MGRPVVPDVYCKIDRVAGGKLPLGFGQAIRGNVFGGSGEALPGEHSGMLEAAQSDDPLQVRKLRAVELAGPRAVQFRTDLAQHGQVGRCLELLDQGQPADFRLGQRIFEFGRPVRRIDRHQHHADAGRGELQQDPLRPVGGPNAESIAAAESEGQQAAGDAIDFPVEFRPGKADSFLAEDHRIARGKSPRRLPQGRPDGQALDPRLPCAGPRPSKEPFQARAADGACIAVRETSPVLASSRRRGHDAALARRLPKMAGTAG